MFLNLSISWNFHLTYLNNCRLWFLSVFQIRKEDKSEVEQNIRDALESVCTPDDVERELRAALLTLNLDSKEDQS